MTALKQVVIRPKASFFRQALLHFSPETAAELGIVHGDNVVVTTPRGRVVTQWKYAAVRVAMGRNKLARLLRESGVEEGDSLVLKLRNVHEVQIEIIKAVKTKSKIKL